MDSQPLEQKTESPSRKFSKREKSVGRNLIPSLEIWNHLTTMLTEQQRGKKKGN